VGRFLGQQSYAVYILHSLVLVALAVALRDTGLDNMLKFGLVAGVGVPLCFVLAAIIRRIPGVTRVV
jgi:peptidoglycan/LPS O-acetylase OafA/YrhL